MYKVEKYYLAKDSKGQYFTKYWDNYWSKDDANAHKFSNPDEIYSCFSDDCPWTRLRDCVLPITVENKFNVIEIEE